MSEQREALLSRFRATLQARVRGVGGLFDALAEAPSDPENRREILGELHTLKGEARMLGLSTLSTLAHALETRVSEESSSSDWARALDAMRVALDEATPAELADVALVEALLELEQRNSMPAPSDRARRPTPAVARDEASGVPLDADTEGRRKGQRWVQVNAAQIDELCERVSELSAAFGAISAKTAARLAHAADGALGNSELMEEFARCRSLLDLTTSKAWQLRLVQLEPTLRELSQHARAQAARAGKALTTEVHAQGVQLERDVLEQLWDSLLHLVQNAVDHGIEPAERRAGKNPIGSLKLLAESRGSSVVLSVEDDGQGIDPAALREAAVARGALSPSRAASARDDELLELVFEHGFSTREDVTQVSGRGVGLDVVRRRLELLGGDVRIDTKLGRGTRFVLSVPFTITKERVLVIRAGTLLYGLPTRSIRAVLGPSELPAGAAGDASVLRFQGQALPLLSLGAVLELGLEAPEQRALVVEVVGRRFGLCIQDVLGERELIRRPAESLLARASPIEASALLDDGRLVLMLDLSFLKRALRRGAAQTGPRCKAVEEPRRQRVLIVDDSPVVCELVKEILLSVGLDVSLAANGKLALESIARSEPDLVLSDVEMPGMGGLELLGEIRSRNQRLPVVMLTTRGSVEDRQRASALGANAYVLKTGFKTDSLLDVIRRFLRVRA